MLYSPLVHPQTDTMDAFVELRMHPIQPSASSSHRGGTLQIMCNSRSNVDLTLVDALIYNEGSWEVSQNQELNCEC